MKDIHRNQSLVQIIVLDQTAAVLNPTLKV